MNGSQHEMQFLNFDMKRATLLLLGAVFPPQFNLPLTLTGD